jgi:hypothetical protein
MIKVSSRLASTLLSLWAVGCSSSTTGNTPDAGPTSGDASTGGDANATTGAPDGAGAAIDADAATDAAATGDEGALCTAADANNHDSDHATPAAIGAPLAGCLQSTADVDFYQFTIPAAPVAGGYVVVGLTGASDGMGVGYGTSLKMQLETVSDGGEIGENYTTVPGGSVFFWFNAVPGQTYRSKVSLFAGAPGPYVFTATYTPVPDAHEPNDAPSQATAIAIGTPVRGYLFAGYTSSNNPAMAAWDDWYQVTLAAGTASFMLSDLATDVNGSVMVDDALGTMVWSGYSTTGGTNVVGQAVPIATAGNYFVQVAPFNDPATSGTGNSVPHYLTQPYTLTVTQ